MNQINKAKNALSTVNVRPMSTEVAEIRRNINMIQEAMQATFKKDIHYGIIPGCGKPSLYKAGAESLIALFKLAFRPETVPVDQKDDEVRYLIRVDLSTRDGVFIGSGIGECSSGEEKYSWRAAICDEEFEATPEHKRRIKFKKAYNGPVTQIKQVRVPPSDMANTILKMAKKRALIDAVLTATAASDIFSQDIEDLPEGYLPPDEVAKDPVKAPEPAPAPAPVVEPEPEPDPEPESGTSNASAVVDYANWPNPVTAQAQKSGPVISDAQRKRLFAIAMGSGMGKENLNQMVKNYGYESSKEITKDDYEAMCAEAESYQGGLNG